MVIGLSVGGRTSRLARCRIRTEGAFVRMTAGMGSVSGVLAERTISATRLTIGHALFRIAGRRSRGLGHDGDGLRCWFGLGV